MATTTNFGWETPDDTDLVKDGAAAIRTVANSIDTSFVDLKGGTTGQILAKASNTDLDYTWIANDTGDITGVTAGTGISGGGTTGTVTINNSMATAIDAKGDLIAGTGADTFDRLAVGANNTVLTADSTTATGLKWATPATTKNFSLLGTGTLTSGTTVTVSGISGRDQLAIALKGCSAGASSAIGLQINTDTGANYYYYGFSVVPGASYATSIINSINSNNDRWDIAQLSTNAASTASGFIMIHGCNTAGLKMIQNTTGTSAAGGNSAASYANGGWWSGTGTVTSISIMCTTGPFDAGSFEVYGSN